MQVYTAYCSVPVAFKNLKFILLYILVVFSSIVHFNFKKFSLIFGEKELLILYRTLDFFECHKTSIKCLDLAAVLQRNIMLPMTQRFQIFQSNLDSNRHKIR